MGLSLVDNLKANSNKSTKKRVDKKYCFGLLLSMLFIGFFYILQILYSGAIILIHNNNLKKALWIVEKHNLMNKLVNNQILLKNALSQRMILGDNTKAMNQSIDVFMKEQNQIIKSKSYEIFYLSELTSKTVYFNGLHTFFDKISNSSICSFTKNLEEKQELCVMLDNKIPSKGFVNNYFRITQYLGKAFETMASGKMDAKTFLNNDEYIEFEYTFENVYMPSLIYIEHEIHEQLEEFLGSHLTETIDFITRLMLISVGFSFMFIVYSFLGISQQVRKVIFSFQLLSINTVINNTVVKYWFLKIHGLNQKTF